ncbi:MAG TPA: TIGR04282 family arsenosugar biosynthesis glycosyltransferase [Clostridia bacterium]|nr:TIGR04282 family arsenosugar biosynthesis glycosyltransferase [Clostridia bacterium]
MKSALILMTRVPLPGKTKTRLETHFTPEQCAKLHTCFLKDIYETAALVDADVFVYFTPEKYRYKLSAILGSEALLRPQCDGGLGNRMHQAIKECLSEGYDKCLLIGTDIPTVSEEMLNTALKLLDDNEIVIGPTLDGGYYLIGMTKAYNEVFDNTFYGVKSVFENTLQHIRTLGVSYSLIKEWYDIDTFKDLQFMIDMNEIKFSQIPNYTRMFLIEAGLLECEAEGEYKAYGNNAE